MPNSSKNRFFTPPKLKPLNLDLASLEGSGENSCPAQYYGKTHDGYKVYCRYRGGWLSIKVATILDEEAYVNGKTLLEERIGPHLDGSISLGQLCRITGVTINKKTPPLFVDEHIKFTPKQLKFANRNNENETTITTWHHFEDEKEYNDLSGETTYYNFNLYCTSVAIEKILKELFKFKKSRIGSRKYDTKTNRFNTHFYSSLLDLFHVDSFFVAISNLSEQQIITKIGDSFLKAKSDKDLTFLPLNFQNFCFSKSFRYGGLKDTTNLIKERFDRTVEIVGNTNDSLFTHLSIRTQFTTDDQVIKDTILSIDRLLSKYFPITKMQLYDIATNSIISGEQQLIPMDCSIINWLNKNKDRYHDVRAKKTDDGIRYRGYRPA